MGKIPHTTLPIPLTSLPSLPLHPLQTLSLSCSRLFHNLRFNHEWFEEGEDWDLYKLRRKEKEERMKLQKSNGFGSFDCKMEEVESAIM